MQGNTPPDSAYTMGYDENFQQLLRRRSAESHAAYLLPHLKPGDRVLDFGCGPGTISVGLASAVDPGELHGVDMEESQIEMARAAARAGGHANATFRVGDGNLPSGFERALFGLRAGDDERLWITPDQGFGLRQKENIRTIRRADFPNDSDLTPGMMMVFNAPGGELPGVLLAVADDTVEVDFNHPLAGRKLAFDVTILRVEA